MRSLFASALLLGLLATPAAAQFNPPSSAHAVMSSAKWVKKNYPNAIASSNISSGVLTIDLKPAAQITSHFYMDIEATFNTSKGNYHPMVPVHSSLPSKMSCTEIKAGNVGSSKKRTTECRMSKEVASAITANTEMTATVAGNGGNKVLKVIVKPYTGPNFMSGAPTIISTGNRPNDLLTFRLRLLAPVVSGQSQSVAWGLTPRECFAQVNPGATYNANWTLNSPNTTTFGAGEQQRDITVRISANGACVGANRKVEAWHPATTSVLSAPTYQFAFFTINQPTP